MPLDERLPMNIVVGGMDGIGLEVARRFVNPDEQLHLLSTDADIVERAAEEFPSSVPLVGHKVQFGNEGACERLVDWLAGSDAPIRRLVTVSAEYHEKGFVEHAREDYRLAAATSECRYFLIQAVARNMCRHGGGSIANICQLFPTLIPDANGSVQRPMPSIGSAGLYSMTGALASELRPQNIGVNAVAMHVGRHRARSGQGSNPEWELVADVVERVLAEDPSEVSGQRFVVAWNGESAECAPDASQNSKAAS